MRELEIIDDAIRQWEDIREKVESRLAALHKLRAELADADGLLERLRHLLQENPDQSREVAEALIKAGLRFSRPQHSEDESSG